MTSMVARQTGMEVRQQDRGGCSFVNLLRASPYDCQGFIEDALSTIEREAPGDIVVLAALRMPELRGFDWQRQDAQKSIVNCLPSAPRPMRRPRVMRLIVFLDVCRSWACMWFWMHHCRCSRPVRTAVRTGSTAATRLVPGA